MNKLMLLLLFLLTACNECEDKSVDECSGDCELCGDSAINSYASCHSKEYCQATIDCLITDVENCIEPCTVCPPCEECSSITCQPTEYCEQLGFSKDWYNSVKPK